MIDRCPHCKATPEKAPQADVIFFTAADGTFCLVCGGEVTFNAKGRARKAVKTTARIKHGPLRGNMTWGTGS